MKAGSRGETGGEMPAHGVKHGVKHGGGQVKDTNFKLSYLSQFLSDLLEKKQCKANTLT